MTKIIALLTSKEFLIACGVIGLAILLCLIIYYIEKSTEKRRRRHNTRELNKLVEEVKKEVPVEEDTKVLNEMPVMEPIIINEETSVNEMIEKTIKVEPIVEEKIEEKVEEPLIIEKIEIVPEEELEYTDIEPDQATAQLELQKIKEELQKQESIEDTQNISLTNYEEEQEENAISSLEELVRKGKEIYDSNEEIQYMDEGNEPISLQELEQRVGRKAEEANEPFIIANVVPEEEVIEIEEKVVEAAPSKEVTQVSHKFTSSPIISPIYGIEKNSINELALENTANYEKLDAEIKKTNEFMMTMRELQKDLE